MAALDSQALQHEDPEAERHCPDCRYLHTGLPDQGLCPECGLAYDNVVIVLRGWDSHRGRGWGDTLPGRLVGGTGLFSLVLLPMIASSATVLHFAVATGLMAVIVGIVLWDREKQLRAREKNPTTDAMITAYKMGQRDGLESFSFARWPRRAQVKMRTVRPGLYRLTIKNMSTTFRVESLPVPIHLDLEANRSEANRILRQIVQWQGRWAARDVQRKVMES